LRNKVEQTTDSISSSSVTPASIIKLVRNNMQHVSVIGWACERDEHVRDTDSVHMRFRIVCSLFHHRTSKRGGCAPRPAPPVRCGHDASVGWQRSCEGARPVAGLGRQPPARDQPGAAHAGVVTWRR